jgi:hypothetical protein
MHYAEGVGLMCGCWCEDAAWEAPPNGMVDSLVTGHRTTKFSALVSLAPGRRKDHCSFQGRFNVLIKCCTGRGASKDSYAQ